MVTSSPLSKPADKGTFNGRPSANERLLADLRAKILDGILQPGTVLSIAEMARRYRVSAIPVREVLQLLVGQGLVSHQSRGDYLIATLSSDELQEIYHVRSSIELAALVRACEQVTASDIDRARVEHRALQDSTVAGDPIAFHRHSRRFHQAMVFPCRMPRLLAMLNTTWDLTEPFQLMQHAPRSTHLQLHADHDLMLTALADRDVGALTKAAQAHGHRLTVIVDQAAVTGDLPVTSSAVDDSDDQDVS